MLLRALQSELKPQVSLRVMDAYAADGLAGRLSAASAVTIR
ncbi:MAG: hypothetical protein ACTSWP_12200 [Candidatus Freyarchaeota archaeon]